MAARGTITYILGSLIFGNSGVGELLAVEMLLIKELWFRLWELLVIVEVDRDCIGGMSGDTRVILIKAFDAIRVSD